MSVFCSGNPGVAKPGFAASIFIGPAAIGAMLNNVPVLFAVPFAAYIGGITYDLTTFCPGEPPNSPLPTAAQFLQLLAPQGDPVGYNNAVVAFRDWIGTWAWPLLCECSGVATPPPPAPPAAPAGLPTINPGQISPLPAAPCFVQEGDFPAIHGTSLVVPSTPQIQIPSNATQARYTVTNTSAGGGPSFLGAQLEGYPNRGLFTGTPDLSPSTGAIAVGATASVLMPITHPAFFYIMEVSVSGTPGTDGSAHLLAEWFCGGPIGTPSVPCCPPDSIASGQLSQILSLVTLLQRQAAPFAYVLGASHAVSGHGQIAVSALIGAKTVITGSIPGTIGDESGNPDEMFGLGWIAWGNADGFSSREFLGHIDNISLPAQPGQYTLLGYSLSPGVTATITELMRET